MSALETPTRREVELHDALAIHMITPTIEDHEELLAEAVESVRVQTIGVRHHVIMDTERRGPAWCRQEVLERVDGEWVAFLDDDDLIDPDHLELLAGAVNEHEADLAFSWYRREGFAPETPRVYEWSDWALGTMLGGRNLIPVTVLARREALLDAGGFRTRDRFEDYALWMRMLEMGCRFAVYPHETWTYRCLGGNRTWGT